MLLRGLIHSSFVGDYPTPWEAPAPTGSRVACRSVAASRVQQVVVMGVSGVGKTTVAKGLSTILGWTFAEGDAFHPEANVDKMASGQPLTDDDRWPWLRSIGDFMSEKIAAGQSAV